MLRTRRAMAALLVLSLALLGVTALAGCSTPSGNPPGGNPPGGNSPGNNPPGGNPPGGGITVVPIVPSVHQVSKQESLPASSPTVVDLSCPAGELALSGGWLLPANASGTLIVRSARYGKLAGEWSLIIAHDSATTVTIYAECLRHAAGATIIERLSSVTVPANNYAWTETPCAGGELLVGGGYFYLPYGLELYNFLRSNTDHTAWLGVGQNHTGSPITLTIYAECLTYAGASVSAVDPNAYTLNAAVATATCPDGTWVSGGGYSDGKVDGNGGISMFASGSKTWQLTANPATTLLARAMCLKL
jgi:hypothetical protein